MLTLGAVAAILVGAVGVVLVAGGHATRTRAARSTPTRTAQPSGRPLGVVWLVSELKPRVLASVPVAEPVANVAVGGGHAWAAGGKGVVEIDATSGSLQRLIPVPGGASSVAYAGGHLWIMRRTGATPLADAVYEINSTTGAERQIVLSDAFDTVYGGAGYVWIPGNGEITRIDPTSGTVAGELPFGLAQPNLFCPVTFLRGSMWIASAVAPNVDTLVRVDAATGHVTGRYRIPIHDSGYCAAAGAGAIWVAGNHHPQILEFDPRSGRLLGSMRVGFGIWLAATRHAVWVNALRRPQELDEITANRATVARVQLGHRPLGFQATGRSVWIGYQQ